MKRILGLCIVFLFLITIIFGCSSSNRSLENATLEERLSHDITNVAGKVAIGYDADRIKSLDIEHLDDGSYEVNVQLYANLLRTVEISADDAIKRSGKILAALFNEQQELSKVELFWYFPLAQDEMVEGVRISMTKEQSLQMEWKRLNITQQLAEVSDKYWISPELIP